MKFTRYFTACEEVAENVCDDSGGHQSLPVGAAVPGKLVAMQRYHKEVNRNATQSILIIFSAFHVGCKESRPGGVEA